jgi:hypothetical protein
LCRPFRRINVTDELHLYCVCLIQSAGQGKRRCRI